MNWGCFRFSVKGNGLLSWGKVPQTAEWNFNTDHLGVLQLGARRP